jgi:glycosyltransferase involved in cell wall biosynthesis
MNIAFVNSTRKWGGVKTWILDFASQLKGHNHQVHIYGRQPEFVREAQQRVGHGVTARFGPDFNPFAISFFLDEFKSKKIEAVFVNIGKDLCTAGVAARLLGIPVIQQIGLPNDIPLRIKTRLLHKWIDPYFLCSSEYIRTGFLKSLPYLNEKKVKTILTAKQVGTAEIGTASPRNIVMTQQLNEDKGHATIFKALAAIDTPFKLHVAGTGRIEAELKQLAANLGLGEKIVWHGFTRDIQRLLQQSDIFILASLVEGLPNTLQEALACGLLPVARDVGGVREVLNSELEQWILPYESGPTEFRNAIHRALSLSDEQLIFFKKQARESCLQFCNIDLIYAEFEDWLRDLIGNNTK